MGSNMEAFFVESGTRVVFAGTKIALVYLWLHRCFRS